MATSVLGLKTFAASDPVDYNEVNDNYNKIDNGVKTAMQGRAAHNLLDNSDFCIAQAGYGGKHGSKTYACDRWYDTYGFGSFSFNELQGLTVAYGTNHAYLVQKIEDASRYHGKTMTLAFGLSDGTIRTANGVWMDNAPSFAINFDNGTATLYTNSVDLVVTSGSLTVKWAALYEGSYDASTLPAYQPKGYAAELAECKRYFQTRDISNYKVVVLGEELYFAIEHSDMRIAPSITIINPISNENNSIANLASGGKFATEIRTITKDRSIIYVATGTSGKSYGVSYTASADL